jgi:hypothetical protein
MSNATEAARQADTLVLLGATGDLAHKRVFPALYAMVKRYALNVPVIGVAYSTPDLHQLRVRVRDIAHDAGGIDDESALDRLLVLLDYIDREPPPLSLRQLLLPADLEPQLRRERPDHPRGSVRRRGSRHVLRDRRLSARRDRDPPLPGGRATRDEPPTFRSFAALPDAAIAFAARVRRQGEE